MQGPAIISKISVAELTRLFEALARAFTSAADAAQAPPEISCRLFPGADAKVGQILTRIKRVLSE